MSKKQQLREELLSDCEYKKLGEHGEEGKVEPTKLEQKRQPTKSAMLALVSGLWYAIGNYIIGEKSDLGFLALFCSNQGNLLFALLYYAGYAISQKHKGEEIWSWENSNFRHPQGGLNYFNFFYLVLYILENVAVGFVFIYWFQFALFADLNQGIITSLFALTSVFSAFLAYMFFHEKLKPGHMVGMGLMIICIVGLSFGSVQQAEEMPQDNPEASSAMLHSILAIVFAILCALGFSVGGLIVRIASEGPKKRHTATPKIKGYNSTDMTVASYVGINIIFLIGTIIAYNVGEHPFILSEYLEMIVSGLFIATGFVSMNYALTIGYAGPIFALANMQVIVQTILDVIFLGQLPTLIEIISACFGIAGSCAIAIMS